ncbi:NADH dehydrogenase [ubiquinone] 1 alpha subcomplex assembly factor 3 [Ditylenchus destructor]|uniref:NADH dehydrogenase [ubiquinone] 1 alpha subcomplex assembly factor 3 n=1 Tax=Ditylenchus destructor TaxID=166010 RepID=A0AAD4NCL4_9BILA|nr:NADH dehydrogenase [ubiquinone] 1 alpha subcomplex assembly factor 3 [Ditylenchus destructor]
MLLRRAKILCKALPSGSSKPIQRRQINDDPRDQDAQFHFIPTGKSDVSHQTRVSFLSKDMSLDDRDRIAIRTVSSHGFRLNDAQFMFGPIGVFPKTVLSWRVLTPDDITEESLELFFLLQPKLDILIVGAGNKEHVDKVRRNVAGVISRHKIGFEVMPTEVAISTFNFLNAEHRYVAAALFPPPDLVVTAREYGRFLRKIPGWEEFRLWEALGANIAFSPEDKPAAIARKIWGNTPEAEEAEKKIRELRDRNRAAREKYLDDFDEKRKADLQTERRKLIDAAQEAASRKLGNK